MYNRKHHLIYNSARSDEKDASLANELQTDSLVIMPVGALRRASGSERRLYVRRIVVKLFPCKEGDCGWMKELVSGIDAKTDAILENWARVIWAMDVIYFREVGS